MCLEIFLRQMGSGNPVFFYYSISLLDTVFSHKYICMSTWRLCLLLDVLDTSVLPELLRVPTVFHPLAEWSAWNHHIILSSLVPVAHFGLGIWHWNATLWGNNVLHTDGMDLAVQYSLTTSTHSWLAAVSWKTGILPCKGLIAIHRQSGTSAAKWSQMNISC